MVDILYISLCDLYSKKKKLQDLFLYFQLWFTRISLLIRIREFTIAESEIDAFKQFDNPDLYFEYYADTFGKERKGTMVPFHFRVLAAEILQYSKKHNETIDRLTRILHTVQQVKTFIIPFLQFNF